MSDYPHLEEREIWTNGRRDAVVCVTATIYPHSIVATADAEHITAHQMNRALKREFPHHTFVFSADLGGNGYLRADADRWNDDGLEPGQGT